MNRLSHNSNTVTDQYEIVIDGILYIITKIEKIKMGKDHPEITKLEIVREIGNEERSKVISEFFKQTGIEKWAT